MVSRIAIPSLLGELAFMPWLLVKGQRPLECVAEERVANRAVLAAALLFIHPEPSESSAANREFDVEHVGRVVVAGD